MRIKLYLLLLVLCAVLCGCGKNYELEEYKDKMDVFFTQVNTLNRQINNIDADDENASAELLQYLDTLQDYIAEMATYEVPEQFSGVDTLAAEAAENMNEAVRLFHEAYGGDTYQANVADAALQYYERVNVRLHYIVSILHGETPEEDD